ncbi:MAG: hypothetical protein RBR22_09950 [Desulfuromonas sp.]|nr:hypothetical protein [Desulfuromonas sp.]
MKSDDLKSGVLIEDASGEVYLLGSCRNKGGSSRVRLCYDTTRLSDEVCREVSEEVILTTCKLHEGSK